MFFLIFLKLHLFIYKCKFFDLKGWKIFFFVIAYGTIGNLFSVHSVLLYIIYLFPNLPFLLFTSQIGDSDGSESPGTYTAFLA